LWGFWAVRSRGQIGTPRALDETEANRTQIGGTIMETKKAVKPQAKKLSPAKKIENTKPLMIAH